MQSYKKILDYRLFGMQKKHILPKIPRCTGTLFSKKPISRVVTMKESASSISLKSLTKRILRINQKDEMEK